MFLKSSIIPPVLTLRDFVAMSMFNEKFGYFLNHEKIKVMSDLEFAKNVCKKIIHMDPIVVYEVGFTPKLMSQILFIIKQHSIKKYQTMEYHSIPMMKNDKKLEKGYMRSTIFESTQKDPRECLILCLETMSNFPHDAIRFLDKKPMQAVVISNSKFIEEYQKPDVELQSVLDEIKVKIPWSFGNMSQKVFIPTFQYKFQKRIRIDFPKHKLISKDLNKVLDPIEGINAPRVQTVYKNELHSVSTCLVKPGMFEIIYPVTLFE